MTSRPAAEADVTEALVRRLLTEQHPDLAGLTLGSPIEGWDCVTVPLVPPGQGPALAVRLPRRAATAPLLVHEQRWLPELRPRLRIPVPAPVRLGTPSAGFAWPWSIVPWFAGAAASTTARADRGAWAPALADFLVDLHRPAPEDAPANPYRGVPLVARDEGVRERLARWRRVDPAGGPGRLLEVWETALEAPAWDDAPVWVHGDLHPANLIVRHGRLAAVIDFIDLAAGDPATDLATAWLTFDGDARAALRAAVDARCGHRAATWARARGWALVLATAMVRDPAMAALAEHTLEQVLLE